MILSANQIITGKQYVMVERPIYEAVVTVLTNESKAGWHGWKVRIDKANGTITPVVGAEISVGWADGYEYYSPVEFYEIEYEES